jgi:hypothetical protein
MKKCNKCNVEKSLSEFNKSKSTKDGLQYKCKECGKKQMKKWREKNKNYIQKYDKKNYEENTDKRKLMVREWREKNPEYHKQYNKENKDKIRKHHKQWVEENKDKLNEYYKQYNKENPHYVRWRNILHRTLKYLNQDKTSPTEEILGYSAIELKQHLDNLGMNWETHHIDHIIPLSWFKKDTPIHLVNDLRNLQPLLEHENKEKSNKFTLQNNQEYISEVKQWIKNSKLKNLNTKRGDR